MNTLKMAVVRNEYGGICGYDPREIYTYRELPKYGIDYEFKRIDMRSPKEIKERPIPPGG